MSRALAILLLLAAVGLAGPERELLREEGFNYRVIGVLPAGWTRRPATLNYTYAIDAIPHAHVHFVRERLQQPVDAKAEVERRSIHYRFPGAPKDVKGVTSTTRWGGRDAVRHEFKANVQGVDCMRRVTVLFYKSVWYELIETVYGEPTEQCTAGLDVFRSGFRLLTDRLAEGWALDTSERKIQDETYGYTITKPQGFLRTEVDTAIDPGCRVAFERTAQNGRQHARVRLFEYAAREALEPEKWFDVFYGSFAGRHRDAKRQAEKPPAIPGAQGVWTERFAGVRDKHAIAVRIFLVWAENGRVYVLRIRTQEDAGEAFAEGLEKVVRTLRAS